MLAASKVTMSGSEKKKKIKKRTGTQATKFLVSGYDYSSIKKYWVTRNFQVLVVQNNDKKYVQVCCRCKFVIFLLLIGIY